MFFTLPGIIYDYEQPIVFYIKSAKLNVSLYVDESKSVNFWAQGPNNLLMNMLLLNLLLNVLAGGA